MSPFYFPVGLSIFTFALNLTHIAVCSRKNISVQGFTRVRTAWLVMLFPEMILSGKLYESLPWSRYTGGDGAAFMMLCIFGGILFPLWAGFGYFAQVFPESWQRYDTKRKNVSEAARRNRLEIN